MVGWWDCIHYKVALVENLYILTSPLFAKPPPRLDPPDIPGIVDSIKRKSIIFNHFVLHPEQCYPNVFHNERRVSNEVPNVLR